MYTQLEHSIGADHRTEGEAASYARVSTTGQDDQGSSLGSQSESNIALLVNHGYSVPSEFVFEEVASGADLERPKLDQVRDLIRGRRIRALAAYSTDRLSRDPVHFAIIAQECQKYGVELLLVTEPIEHSPEGVLLTFVRGWAAQLERAKIQERTQRGKKDKVRVGELPTGRVPWWLKYNRETGKAEMDYEMLPHIKHIISMYLNGNSMRRCVRYLRERGVVIQRSATRTFDSWMPSTMRNTFTNRALLGEFWYMGNLVYKDDSLAVVTEGQWDRLQKRMATNKAESLRNTKHSYPPIQRKVRCLICGNKLYAKTQPGTGYQCFACTTCGYTSSARRLWDHIREELVWNFTHVANLKQSIARYIRGGDAERRLTDRIHVLQAELASKNGAIDRAIKTVVRYPKYSERFDAETKKLEAERTVVERELRAVEAQLRTLVSRSVTQSDIKALVKKAKGKIETFTDMEWRTLVDRIELTVGFAPRDHVIKDETQPLEVIVGDTNTSIDPSAITTPFFCTTDLDIGAFGDALDDIVSTSSATAPPAADSAFRLASWPT